MTTRDSNILIQKSVADKLQNKDYLFFKITNSKGSTSPNLKVVKTTDVKYTVLNHDDILNDYTNKKLLVKSSSPLSVVSDKIFYITIPGTSIPQYVPNSTDQFTFKITPTNPVKTKMETYIFFPIFINKTTFRLYFRQNENNEGVGFVPHFLKNTNVYIKEYKATIKNLRAMFVETGRTWPLDKYGGTYYNQYTEWYFDVVNQGTLPVDDFNENPYKPNVNPKQITLQILMFPDYYNHPEWSPINRDVVASNIDSIPIIEYINSIPEGNVPYTCMSYTCSSSSSNDNTRTIGCDWIPRMPTVCKANIVSFFDKDIPFIDVPPLDTDTYTLIEYDQTFNVPSGNITISPYRKVPMPELEPTGIIALQDGRQGVYCSYWGLEDTQILARNLRSNIEYQASNIDDLYTRLVV